MTESPQTELSPGTSDCSANRAPLFALRTAGIALAITLAQVLLACLLSGQREPLLAYHALCQWDGPWFANVAEKGYSAPAHLTPQNPGNAAFFPGYPLLTRLLQNSFHLEIKVALLLAAQVSCWGFWTYFLLLCQRWGLSARGTAWAALLVGLQPCSFFLVASYSEPLFLCLLFGFLYWSGRSGFLATMLAALHGFGMTATRLVGIPLAILPLAAVWVTHLRRQEGGFHAALRRSFGPLCLMIAASAGALSYFAYCHFHLGRWDMPMKAHEVGWAVHPCYYAIFSYRLFRPLLGHGLLHGLPMRDGFMDPNVLDQFTGGLLWLFLAGVFLVEIVLRRRGLTGWRDRAALYLGAFLLYYVSISGHLTRQQSSMIRFAVCILAMLVPPVIMLAERWGRPLPLRVRIGLGVWLVTSVAWNLILTYRYTHGFWVA